METLTFIPGRSQGEPEMAKPVKNMPNGNASARMLRIFCHRFSTVSFSGFGILLGGLAQLGERLLCKQEASGSSPLISTIRVASSAG